MSKSPNLFIPAAGGAALLLGVAYGVATNQWTDSKLDVMGRQVEEAQAAAGEAMAMAEAEAARVAEIEADAAKIQEEARLALATASGGSISEPAPISSDGYGLGRAALPEEIAAWDVDVLPDGRGLPEGAGNVFDGEEVFAERCGSCHGDFGEGVDNWPVLAGGFDTLADEDPVKTVGSYWPYLSTAWDYIHRSMPFGEAGTLTADETYAIVAYILYSNDLVDDDFELSHENFAEFEMYNATGFVIDDRPDLEYSQWQTEPCMENCKDEVQVTMRSVFLVETPPEGGSNSVMNEARNEELPSFTADGPSFIPEATVQEASAAQEVEPVEDANGDAALLAAGEKAFKKCQACHQIGEGATNKTGPHLNGVFGRTIGGMDGFSYSTVFKTAAEEGRVWDDDSMGAFLTKPRDYFKGTKMAFAGFKKPEDVEAIIAYLKASGQ